MSPRVFQAPLLKQGALGPRAAAAVPVPYSVRPGVGQCLLEKAEEPSGLQRLSSDVV